MKLQIVKEEPGDSSRDQAMNSWGNGRLVHPGSALRVGTVNGCIELD